MKVSELLFTLLDGKSECEFSADELSHKAHWRWDREFHLEAAILFDAAFRVASNQSQTSAFSYQVRSGICFRLANELDRAWPILLEATQFDWSTAKLISDSHMSEWAFVQMLTVHFESKDTPSFVNLFELACQRGNELSQPFPSSYPHQDSLLAMCSELQLRDQFDLVADKVLQHRGKSRKLKKLIEGLRQF